MTSWSDSEKFEEGLDAEWKRGTSLEELSELGSSRAGQVWLRGRAASLCSTEPAAFSKATEPQDKTA